ncbi:MAG: FtsH protease activity modulator HflK [Chloroflexi bacterium]|nr:FtsH protease activity modulator HflK [Chloroflexota bacterium]
MSARNEPVPYEDLKSYRPPSDRDSGPRPPRPPRDDAPEQINLEDVIEKIRAGLPNFGGRKASGGIGLIIVILALVIGAIWFGSGVYTVGPDEQGVLRTWGQFTGTAGEGLHWHWPGPVGQRNIESVTQTRRIEVGFRGGSDGQTIAQTVPVESLMITGDENIVDVQMVAQYRINDLPAFLFNVSDPGDPDRGIGVNRAEGRTLRDVAETAIRQVVGARNIDDVLTTGKEQVQADAAVIMEDLLNSYGAGIEIISVLLQNVNPPEEVRDAFEDVVRAQEDRDRLVNLAQAYRADQIPRATGRAAQITEEAQGFKDGRIARATGEAEGFKQLLEGYIESKEVTRQRLYLEAMEGILPGMTKFILTEQVGGVLPFLPLDGNTSSALPGLGGTN